MRVLPKRDIVSPGMMGWGLDLAGNSFAVAAAVVVHPLVYTNKYWLPAKTHVINLYDKNVKSHCSAVGHGYHKRYA